MSYGIGRVPRDVDPTDEAMANLRAAEETERRLSHRLPRKPADDYRECSSCGQTGYVGSYPFSTVYSPNRRCLCDDCV